MGYIKELGVVIKCNQECLNNHQGICLPQIGDEQLIFENGQLKLNCIKEKLEKYQGIPIEKAIEYVKPEYCL